MTNVTRVLEISDMKQGDKCPNCSNGHLVEGKGKLDQSGQTHITTTTIECPTCGLKVWRSATNTRWEKS